MANKVSVGGKQSTLRGSWEESKKKEKQKIIQNEIMGGGPFDEEMGKYEMKTLSSLGGGPFLKMKMKILSF